MSIESKLVRLSDARDDIITSLMNKEVDATGHGFEDFSSDIDSISVDATLISKTIDSNGNYDALSDDADGYSSIEVVVRPGRITPHYFDLHPNQYVYTGGVFKLNGETVNYSDVYEVEANTQYFLALGAAAGSRFRVLFTTEDTSTTTVELRGKSLAYLSDPSPYYMILFKTTEAGYVTVTKDNAGTANIPTYLFETVALIHGLVE